MAYPPPPVADEYAASALLMARMEPIAEASSADIRARSRPGTVMAATTPMIPTTTSSSISVKPFSLLAGPCVSAAALHS